jgi:thiamine biosynthesis lipoprotein
LVADWLKDAGHLDGLVEIGGEVVAFGRNGQREPWRIAVEKPVAGERTLQTVLHLKGAGMATSGNYRRFWERDGKRYGHSLNPLTGFPERSRLLSATVVAKDCATADAWATACMVMGLERSLEVLEQIPGVEAYCLYLEEGSDGIAAAQTLGFAALTDAE